MDSSPYPQHQFYIRAAAAAKKSNNNTTLLKSTNTCHTPNNNSTAPDRRRAQIWTEVIVPNMPPKVYRVATQEIARIDHHLLEYLPVLKQRMENWIEQNVFQQSGLDVSRVHALQERLHEYVNSLSADGSYVELLPDEMDFVANLGQWLLENPETPYRLVEVGLNVKRRICKIGFVIQIPLTERFLFVCVGMDVGLKTFYVTNEFKNRSSYRGDVNYWTLEDWNREFCFH